MNIGDKVRVIQGIEEGIITRIINDKLIEIEIEDGFTMPVMKSEVVVVASEEKNHFQKESTNKEIKSVPQSLFDQGAYLAFEFEEGKDNAECYFINHTNKIFVNVVSEEQGKGAFQNLSSQITPPSKHIKIGNYRLSQFDKWPTLTFHLTEIDSKNRIEPSFIKKTFSPKAKNFFKTKTKSPLRNQPAYVFNLLDGGVKINPEELKEQLFKGEDEFTENPYSNEAIEVDLHIETLREDHEFLSSEEILPIQLIEFEKNLDDALVKNRPEITFIHGIGSGKLKHEVSKILSKHPHVRYYEDANKTRFGYGATKAVFK